VNEKIKLLELLWIFKKILISYYLINHAAKKRHVIVKTKTIMNERRKF